MMGVPPPIFPPMPIGSTMTSEHPVPHHPDSPRVAVVGGGITGLSAAHRLIELSAERKVPVAVELFEATERIGGVFGSQRIGDYLIERGADSFITNKPAALRLCERLGLAGDLISTNPRYRRSLILFHGKPVATPEGFNLLAPSRIWPVVTTPLLSWKGKLRLAMEYVIPAKRTDDEESLAQFVRRRFGAEVLDRIAQPMVGGIYTSDPEKLSLEATLPRFPELERKYGSVIRGLRRSATNDAESASGARYGLFASLRHGMSQLQDALGERIRRHGLVTLNKAVAEIRHDSGSAATPWRLTFADGSQRSFAAVIVTLPTHRAAEVLQGERPDLAAALNEIEYAGSAIVVSGHSLSDIEHPMDAFGLVIPHSERRRILATSFLSRKFEGRAPAGKIILRTFVGGAMQSEEYEHSDGEIVNTVMAELRSIFGLRGEPDFAVIARYPKGMPQFLVGHSARVARIRELLTRTPGLELAGNAYDGVGLPDSIHSGESSAERVLAHLC